ncbi:Histidinol-phosphate aminotransferase [Pseudomonas fluorescens]|uniref:Histidinol-phosphate aminotransferase n=1 Tax=Pseudomonas fluorescens TaxID=294 RepID=A0A5E6R9L8_PSEFL|nr:PLP-dependent aminotransferase family protein [Pseudomonas fluorescens]VVM61988.1 Histidinol-phosphate aminotransferase [Pseudomonas fluorescens]
MELRIDRQALVPVVQQIVDALACWIRQTQLSPGTRLPSARQIARINLLSQSSVVEACDRLVAQGVLAARHGAGFFIVAAPASTASAPWLDGADAGPLTATQALPLGCGGVPHSWRETDDLGYAIRQVSRSDMAAVFDYNTPLGLPALRQQILKRLRLMDIAANEDCIMTVAGASQGLDLIVRTLFDTQDCVVVESPGNPMLFELLKLHGVLVFEVPRTPCGPDIEALQTLLLKHQPRALFINSFHHNPTGSSLGPAVARRVVQLARTHGLVVVEDDVYADLHSGRGVRLAALDPGVIYIGSFSKTLSSSLRVGFIVAKPAMIAKLAKVKTISSLGTSAFSEAVLTCLLTSGAYHKLVQRLRQRLDTDRAAALQMLEDAEWEVFGKPGGLFIWARSRPRTYAEVTSLARRFGVSLSSQTAFSFAGQTGEWQRINVTCACDSRARAFFHATTPDRP